MNVQEVGFKILLFFLLIRFQEQESEIRNQFKFLGKEVCCRRISVVVLDVWSKFGFWSRSGSRF